MEYIDICDESGSPTGEIIDRETAHRDGILHRTAHVWIVRKKTQGYDILLQKRSMEKDSFPGLYDTSSAGHIPTGSEPLPSAIRELKEELGIAAKPEQLIYAGSFRIQYEEVFHDQVFKDNEITKAYVYQEPEARGLGTLIPARGWKPSHPTLLLSTRNMIVGLGNMIPVRGRKDRLCVYLQGRLFY